MLLFVIVGSVGLILLLSSILIGDLLDLVGVGEGLVSGVAVGAALSIFGLAGIVSTANDLPTVWTYVIAVAFALVALVLIQLFVSRVAQQESGGHYSPVDLTGVTTVSTTPAGGEVRLDDIRELERRPAVSDIPLTAGTRIRVVAEDGFRVRVAPLGSEPQGSEPSESEPLGTEPPEPEPSGTEPRGTEPWEPERFSPTPSPAPDTPPTTH